MHQHDRNSAAAIPDPRFAAEGKRADAVMALALSISCVRGYAQKWLEPSKQ